MILAITFYQIGFYVLLGLLAGFGSGVVVGVRIAPPTSDTEVKLGSLKVKVRGKDNIISDAIDITDIIDIDTAKEIRKAERLAKRAARKNRKLSNGITRN